MPLELGKDLDTPPWAHPAIMVTNEMRLSGTSSPFDAPSGLCTSCINLSSSGCAGQVSLGRGCAHRKDMRGMHQQRKIDSSCGMGGSWGVLRLGCGSAGC
ncbi:hypothetical protein BV22DRAFT_911424 [Leucogyrophana mollusca]|uniref:Uncharacterized protein n=1 Tax=Leucogyrophana mollusca TaxID=85980 RepID=A0ACB8AXN3_9AGAM|nr:hypothetical protein BV22DRAFT_911424 [Leucogyrophana mollusca]